MEHSIDEFFALDYQIYIKPTTLLGATSRAQRGNAP
jgi:hypothetical protein